MTSEDSVDAIAQKTGASSDQATKLIASSLPLLLNGMTNNASTEDGARSLAGALTQHTDTGTMVQQITDVDDEDGGKIVQHILGSDSENVINALAKETQLDTRQVSTGLASLAPALMSVLSAFMKMSSQSGGGLDLSGLFGMFGGSQQNASSSLGLLSGLLGGGSAQNTAGGLGSLLGGLMGGNSAQAQQSSGLGNVLGSLLGGGSQASGGLLGGLFGGSEQPQVQSQQADTGAYDGSQLISLLSSLMK